MFILKECEKPSERKARLDLWSHIFNYINDNYQYIHTSNSKNDVAQATKRKLIEFINSGSWSGAVIYFNKLFPHCSETSKVGDKLLE